MNTADYVDAENYINAQIRRLSRQKRQILRGNSDYPFLNSIIGGNAFSGKIDRYTMTYRTDLSDSELFKLQENLNEYRDFMVSKIKPMADRAKAVARPDTLTLYRCLGVANLPARGQTFRSILPTSWTRKISFAKAWCRTVTDHPVIYKATFSLYDPLLIFSREGAHRPTRSVLDIPYNQDQAEVLVAPGELTVEDIRPGAEGVTIITLDASQINWLNLPTDIDVAIKALPIDAQQSDDFSAFDMSSAAPWDMSATVQLQRPQ
jgi:hypothetical protein